VESSVQKVKWINGGGMAQLKIVWSKEAQDDFLQFRYPYMYPAT
jgi:hypothetical protein